LLDSVSRIPHVPTAIITAAALLTAGLVVLSTSRDASAAQQPPSVSLVSDISGMSPSYGSAVSSDGRWVAFETLRSGEPSRVWLRDMTNSGSTRLVPGLENLNASLPSMSGDAGLIAVLGDGQLHVLNRRDPDHPVLRQVTGTPNDLPYQRISCSIGTSDGGRGQACAPKLSRDGSTLVAYLVQSVRSGDVEVTIAGQSAVTDRGFYPVLDFGAYATSAESTVALKNVGALPIVYPDTGPVIDGDARFTVSSSTCAATLQPGASCSVTVKFLAGSDCADEADAVLRFPATSSAAGQTAVKLTGGGECGVLSALPAAQAADCSGPSEFARELPAPFDPNDSGDGHPHPWFALGGVSADELGIAALTIRNTTPGPAVPKLTSPGCELKLVLPAAAGADACKPGQPVPALSSTTSARSRRSRPGSTSAARCTGSAVMPREASSRPGVILGRQAPSARRA
jgi:hypothetical protein